MNIFFDARWTRIGVHDGISRYTANLVEALAKLHPVTMIIHDKRQLELLPKNIPHVMLANPISPGELLTPRRLNKLGADIVFSPMQVMATCGRRYKLIFTLHDIIYYQYKTPPHQLPWSARLAWRLFHMATWPQRALLNQADHVATVSRTSKELIRDMHLTDRPISVIYNASSLTPAKPAPTRQKDLVFMGSFMEYKNVELLLRSMKLLPEYTLHLTSRISEERRYELERLIDNPKQVIFWNGISDTDYAKLLRSAHALVSASKAEGFGLPLLEAMTQGTPVVVSDMPIFHEVGGLGGTYFNPNSIESFAAAVRKLEDPSYHKRAIEQGIAHATIFTWDNSAAALLSLMRELTKQ